MLVPFPDQRQTPAAEQSGQQIQGHANLPGERLAVVTQLDPVAGPAVRAAVVGIGHGAEVVRDRRSFGLRRARGGHFDLHIGGHAAQIGLLSKLRDLHGAQCSGHTVDQVQLACDDSPCFQNGGSRLRGACALDDVGARCFGVGRARDEQSCRHCLNSMSNHPVSPLIRSRREYGVMYAFEYGALRHHCVTRFTCGAIN